MWLNAKNSSGWEGLKRIKYLTGQVAANDPNHIIPQVYTNIMFCLEAYNFSTGVDEIWSYTYIVTNVTVVNMYLTIAESLTGSSSPFCSFACGFYNIQITTTTTANGYAKETFMSIVELTQNSHITVVSKGQLLELAYQIAISTYNSVSKESWFSNVESVIVSIQTAISKENQISLIIQVTVTSYNGMSL